MIADLAVAQGILVDREAKMAAAERRRQMEFARTGAIAVTTNGLGVFGKVVSFVQGLRSERVEQGAPALAGEAAA